MVEATGMHRLERKQRGACATEGQATLLPQMTLSFPTTLLVVPFQLDDLGIDLDTLRARLEYS